jgi:hypothetical protein
MCPRSSRSKKTCPRTLNESETTAGFSYTGCSPSCLPRFENIGPWAGFKFKLTSEFLKGLHLESMGGGVGFLKKCSGKEARCFILRAWKGRQKVARGKQGQELREPPSPSRRPGSAFRPILVLSPQIARLWLFGGRSRERGTLVAKWRVSRFVVFLSPSAHEV